MSSFEPLGNTIPGRVLSSIYGMIVSLRNHRYNLLPSPTHDIPTISIGGISAGGTGKTPLTDLIIKELYSKGYTPVLLSRGYGRNTKETILVKPHEKEDWRRIGDEPAMLKRKNPYIWLAIDGNRRRAFKKIRPLLPSNAVLIMDDGFQHRQFHRHLDILTLPVSILRDKLIPMGLMREPLNSLKRASVILVIASPGEEEEQKNTLHSLKALYPDKLTLPITIKATEWTSLSGAQVTSTITEEITLLSGIARPERFIKAARATCKQIKKVYTFPDHHLFTDVDFKRLEEVNTPIIGTTEKDLIRLNTENFDNREKLWYLIAVVCFNTELQKQDFFDYIDKSMRQLR